MNRVLSLLLIAVLAAGIGALAFKAYADNQRNRVVAENATLLLERVRKVAKLVTVEGDVSEIFNSRQERNVTLFLPLPTRFSFQKNATVEVSGTVLVGYDLEGVDFRIDEQARTLTVRNLPEPEILAIDHQLAYRNLEESWFNDFTAQDYTELNRRAKERLRDRALSSRLLEEARAEGSAVLEGIRFMAESAGYTLVVEHQPTPATPTQR